MQSYKLTIFSLISLLYINAYASDEKPKEISINRRIVDSTGQECDIKIVPKLNLSLYTLKYITLNAIAGALIGAGCDAYQHQAIPQVSSMIAGGFIGSIISLFSSKLHPSTEIVSFHIYKDKNVVPCRQDSYKEGNITRFEVNEIKDFRQKPLIIGKFYGFDE